MHTFVTSRSPYFIFGMCPIPKSAWTTVFTEIFHGFSGTLMEEHLEM
jgi:hypothetical protein